ncbi:SufBD protein [archaeon SCG-AAA382B04]|nr:SufBD protein [archaeon SCG-AAA382B04]
MLECILKINVFPVKPRISLKKRRMEDMKIEDLYEAAEIEDAVSDPDVAHLIINKDKIVGENEIAGLSVNAVEIEDGVDVEVVVEEDAVIEKPVHMCFGMTQEEGLQRIILDMDIRAGSEIGILAHCVFPKAVDVRHEMDAEIRVGEDAEYSYLEKHIHSPKGGLEVVPKAEIMLERRARYKNDFELVEGRVGELDIDYECVCEEDSILEMTAKVDGKEDDDISIREAGDLVGEGARGVLTTRVAARDDTDAEVINELSAEAAYTRGHVDCKEIIQDRGEARAVPIVDVHHPLAHVTHEAAIGSVDRKQLEALMARGLSEEEGVDLIIQGLLS